MLPRATHYALASELCWKPFPSSSYEIPSSAHYSWPKQFGTRHTDETGLCASRLAIAVLTSRIEAWTRCQGSTRIPLK
ncbi:uncharacterized protein BJX67DRAFT_365977 [Aspergillus lucknowensis]|uniref:Uncharacterized protein n=1 Tax=Aspergillus lucknowensis TaxID=176173 RepID=A0ABR4LDP6_9EURO